MCSQLPVFRPVHVPTGAQILSPFTWLQQSFPLIPGVREKPQSVSYGTWFCTYKNVEDTAGSRLMDSTHLVSPSPGSDSNYTNSAPASVSADILVIVEPVTRREASPSLFWQERPNLSRCDLAVTHIGPKRCNIQKSWSSPGSCKDGSVHYYNCN